MRDEIIKQYFNDNKELTLLIDRNPILDRWTEVKVSQSECYKHKGNLGWKLGPEDIVIDVDPRNNGLVSFKKLAEKFKLKIVPTVITASGGYHYYAKIPQEYLGRRFKKTMKREYPGIDFLTQGAQCVIPGSVCVKKYPKDVAPPEKPEMVMYEWYDKEFGCFEQSNELTTELFDYISYKPVDSVNGGDAEDFGISSTASNWKEEKVRKLLSKLDPNVNNDEWVKIGMALHDWHPVEGLALWEEWSKPGDTYKDGETERRWHGFKPHVGITLGTISFMAMQSDMDETLQNVRKYVERIKSSTELDLRTAILPDLKKENFSKLDINTIAMAVKCRYKELNGVNMPIGDIRGNITNKDAVRGSFIADGEVPEWCKEWTYVNSHTGFMDLNTLKIRKTEAFNLQNGIHVPLSEGGTKCSAMKFVSDNKYIEQVDSTAYLPNTEELIVDIGGSKVLNIFNPNTVPTAAEEYTKNGLLYIERIKKHIRFICGSDNDSQILTEYFAHMVQFPGKKILWSPVIQSIQGVGKSFFGEMMRAVLGNVNVGVVSSNEVVSNFNGWATNVQLNILEEIRIKGHNRYDAVNALKPLITDSFIQINEKGVKPYMTHNLVNYMCFTNHRDAIPMDDDDRRWWVIFVAIKNITDLHRHVGESKETYFRNLFNNLLDNAGEVRKWLLSYNISDKFLNTKQAPMTRYKQAMIATEETGYEGLTELKELIIKGGEFYNTTCISSAELFSNFTYEYPDIILSDNKKNLLLKKLGYMSHASPMKINGKTRRIWTNNPMTKEDIRESFEDL